MVAGAEVIHQSLTVVDVSYCRIAKGIEGAVDSSSPAVAVASPVVMGSGSVGEGLVRFLDLGCNFFLGSVMKL